MVDSKLMKNVFLLLICKIITYDILYDPFLEAIWNNYKFDEYITSGDATVILKLCNRFNRTTGNSAEEEFQNCATLSRNLKVLYNSRYTSNDDFNKHCNNINNWLYYKIKEHKMSDDTITEIFSESKQIIENEGYLFCRYSPFNNDFLEPEKLVMLSIFNDNIDYIKEILSQETHYKISSCRNFIKQCVHLYKSMHNIDCSKGDFTEPNKIFTCYIVNEFKNLYCSSIYN
ncbi:hypothetical protein PCYB_007750, partial [Plasmodium cynomolgi strain B]